jgi:phosphotransferase system enzyme I (PtsI)
MYKGSDPMSLRLSGIAASPGIAIAKAYLLQSDQWQVEKIIIADADAELIRFDQAIAKTEQDLQKLKIKTAAELGEAKSEIFDAHLSILKDPELIDSIKDKISDEKTNAESALEEVSQMFIGMLEEMDDERLSARAADLRDISKRILKHLINKGDESSQVYFEEVIIVANDLTPSDTAELDLRYVKGFITDIGSRTSHSSILARSMEIPAVVGAADVSKTIQPDMLLILDGFTGELIVDPSEEVLAQYRQKKLEHAEEKAESAKFTNLTTVTKDGFELELAANIGRVEDVQGALENGAEAVGLFRTEFLFMDRKTMPSEEEQFKIYKYVLEKMHPKPVIIRTLDIGGDKQLPYLKLAEEMNPFLGVRAIRLCLDQPELFRTQLRALLRASEYGHLKIMFPMIAILSELRQAKKMLNEEKAALLENGVAVSDHIELGIMIEIPAAAIMADQFAKEIDFFSIGTNDLIQYTMAADRMNERVSYLYQPYHPSILRLIHMVVKAANQEGKWVGMCGEMAADPIAVPILLGMGLKELSMSAASIPSTRALLSKINRSDCSQVIADILSLETEEQVEQLVKSNLMGSI